ncbi:COG1525 Micrococcal nuclease (thermonuclease) homologs [Paracoccaceae bacterium]
MSRYKPLIQPAILRFLMALGCAFSLSASPVTAQGQVISGVVMRVTDGDTFRLSGLDVAVRVWGLDAPERKQRGGTAATNAMRDLIDGKTLTCVERDIDRYRRVVGQCFLENGQDIAAAMIAAGVAREYCRYSRGFYGTC